MEDTLLIEEEEQLKVIRDRNRKNVNNLNKKNLSQDELDEIFCDF